MIKRTPPVPKKDIQLDKNPNPIIGLVNSRTSSIGEVTLVSTTINRINRQTRTKAPPNIGKELHPYSVTLLNSRRMPINPSNQMDCS